MIASILWLTSSLSFSSILYSRFFLSSGIMFFSQLLSTKLWSIKPVIFFRLFLLYFLFNYQLVLDILYLIKVSWSNIFFTCYISVKFLNLSITCWTTKVLATPQVESQAVNNNTSINSLKDPKFTPLLSRIRCFLYGRLLFYYLPSSHSKSVWHAKK